MEGSKRICAKKSIWLVFIALTLSACNREKKITKLLQSENKDDLIEGAFMAGKSKDKKFVPYLLKDCYDARTSTNIRFKGFSVYQEKMIALRKIFNITPPVKIKNKPDSTVIKFYMRLNNDKALK